MEKQPMTCEEAREAIDGLTAKRPSAPAGERAFHEHIGGCAACRKLYEETQAQNQLLDAWVAPAPRGNIQARVMAGIARMERELREKERRPDLWDRTAALLFGRRFRVPAIAALGLAMLLLASLGLNAVLLASRRPEGRQWAAIPMPAQSLMAANKNVVKVAVPTLTPAGGENEAVQAFVRNGLAGLGAYSQQTGAMPLGIIVILGVPPMEGGSRGSLTDI
jgi:hypothetical protein